MRKKNSKNLWENIRSTICRWAISITVSSKWKFICYQGSFKPQTSYVVLFIHVIKVHVNNYMKGKEFFFWKHFFMIAIFVQNVWLN